MDWGSLGHQSLDIAEIPHLGCFPLVCLSFGGIIISMLEEIKTRRSIREFTSDNVDDKTVDLIIEMGTWAPSGLNNQPWKFTVIRDQYLKDEIAAKTTYSHIIKGAPVCIAVFLDNSQSYNRIKDIQAIGACI